ncbi:MAG: c-type cytochrome [Anaerolineae bacterium]|nr:c-type cytochrome [Anaerolineae bacterium]
MSFRLSHLLPVLFVLLLISGCALSGEPPIVRTMALPTVTPTVPPDLGYPVGKVDMARGAEIFGGAQGCQLCHGITGEGNGQVAASIACSIVSFKDAEANQSKALTAWFAIISNGNNGSNACPMPPWKNQLNEQDRWNVANYIYSLHYTPDRMTAGKQVWEQQCTACHSATGESAKPEVTVDLSDPAALINRSDTQMFRLLTEGKPDGSHKFDTLTEEQRWSVVAYTRSLGWVNNDAVGVPAQTPTPAPVIPDTDTITVAGKLTNGTKDAATPANLPLTLRVIETTAAGFNDALKLDTSTTADGSFSFGAVARRNGLVYVLTTNYAGILQNSEPIQLQTGSGPTLDLSFTIYEATTDPKDIRADVERIFVSFDSPTQAFIQQGILFRNIGDRIFTGTDGVSLQVQLPAQAAAITLSQDSSSFRIGNGALIYTAIPFAPGDTTLQFSYELPFAGDLTVQQPASYEVDQLSVHVAQSSGALLITPGYQRGEPIQLSDDTGKVTPYDTYDLVRPILAGESVTFSIRFGGQESERRNLLALLLFAAMLTILGIGLAIWRLDRRDKGSQ